jgi:elongation factor G
MELVAETDDDLIERFLEEGELSREELAGGLRAAVLGTKLTPVCVVAAIKGKGTSVLLDTIVDLFPSPQERPAKLGIDPEGELVERKGLDDQPFSAQVVKTMADPFAGRLTILRVFSGTLSGDSFYNSTKGVNERFAHLFVMEGKGQKAVETAVPGMIVAVARLKETGTGDTFCDEQKKDNILYEPLEPMSPVISYAVSAKEGDEEKLFSSITRMLDEDLTLKLPREPETNEILISGVGQIHLEVIGERIKRKFGVEMELRIPKIPYRETIKGRVTVQGKHKKQSGGRGQFGDCTIEMSPLARDKGFEFIDSIVGGVIPQQHRPAVEKGIIEAMEKGVIAGYPFVDVRVNLIDGSFHNVDSSEMAFKIAGSLAFKKGVEEAGAILLEPIMEIAVKVHDDHVGDIMGDMNSRRGKVLGMDAVDNHEVIRALVPQAEVQLYALDLTSMTGGRGTFTVKFSHYEEVPAYLGEKVIENRK